MRTLFESTTIKGLELNNRFVRSATWEAMAETDGSPSESLMQMYEELAQGGVGLLITSYAHISKMEKPNEGMLGIYEDAMIPKYKEMVQRVHATNTKIALQIVYGGSFNGHKEREQMTIYGASAVENKTTGVTPIAATKAQLQEIVTWFGDAALRAKAAGFDAVEIHAAHGYFLNLFLTPYYNRREDEYGGSIHNRARLIYEVMSEVRNRVGEDFPIMIKLNVSDFMEEGGYTFEEALAVCKRLDELGIDLIELSGGNLSMPDNSATFHSHKNVNLVKEQSYFYEQANIIADEIEAKIILVGGNKTFSRMEEILNSSMIAYFGLSRTLFSQPDLIQTWKEAPNSRAKCVSCNHCWDQKPHVCILNKK